ncbi:MAG: hypothetical protein HY235_30480 [Acidobacteria bacterium]|nr:hypothetical protein [Acidobacteriota bacterium]
MPDLGYLKFPLVIFAGLVTAVIGLALYRHFVSKEEDYHIHAKLDEASSVGRQFTNATRLLWIDRWGKGLTVLSAVYFFVLLAVILYNEWHKTTTTVLTQ